MREGQTKIYEEAFEKFLTELIEISDAFDQLGKLAIICDMLYDQSDPQHPRLFKALEKTARHLRGNRNIGSQEKKL